MGLLSKDSAEVVTRHAGKVIGVARMLGESLQLVFVDGCAIRIADDAQACCEVRDMTCDDDLESFRGDKFLGVDVLDVLDGPAVSDSSAHNVLFLHVRTSGGSITCQTHNEHNGYYGGFDVVVKESA
jgi:hypothetical protein